MTTIGADKASELTINTIEIQPGEDMVKWYNCVTKIFQERALEFKDLPHDVKQYMLHGPSVRDQAAAIKNENKPKLKDATLEAFAKQAQETLDTLMAEHDQMIKADAGKEELRLVPMEIMRNIATIRTYGNNKYKDPESWRRVAPERYIDAMMRHAIAFVENPTSVDEESKLPHLHHLACNVAFLCEMYKDKLSVNHCNHLQMKGEQND